MALVKNQATLNRHTKAPLYVVDMTFGSRLKAARKRARLTQQQLGDSRGIEVSAQAVSQWERDETMPETEKIHAIARRLGVMSDDLLQDENGTRREALTTGWQNLDHPHERLRWSVQRRYKRDEEAARALGIDVGLFADYLSGERDFAQHADVLSNGLMVDHVWLVTGHGAPDSAARVIDLFHGMAEEDQAKFIELGELFRDRNR